MMFGLSAAAGDRNLIFGALEEQLMVLAVFPDALWNSVWNIPSDDSFVALPSSALDCPCLSFYVISLFLIVLLFASCFFHFTMTSHTVNPAIFTKVQIFLSYWRGG